MSLQAGLVNMLTAGYSGGCSKQFGGFVNLILSSLLFIYQMLNSGIGFEPEVFRNQGFSLISISRYSKECHAAKLFSVTS